MTQLRHLVSDRSLLKVRFILVELEPAPSRALAIEMGGFAESVDVHPRGGCFEGLSRQDPERNEDGAFGRRSAAGRWHGWPSRGTAAEAK